MPAGGRSLRSEPQTPGTSHRIHLPMALAMKTCAPMKMSGVSRPCLPARVHAVRPLPSSRSRAVAAKAVSGQEAQMKDAMARWENQVNEGSVVSVSGAEAGRMMQEGWTLLDVRPPGEASKVPIVGAITVPLFIEDPGMGISSLAAKGAFMGSAGGWWTGGTHMIPNREFIQQVQANIPKDAKIVVACQKGLRSLAACEQLSRAGYGTGLAWINGGCDTCKKGDMPTAGDVDLRYAGIGGFSEVLGWTEVQTEDKKQLLGGAGGVIGFFCVILGIDVAIWLVEAAQHFQETGVFRIAF
ncbi:hypothetical protein FOA52_003844 [Chlamydomonas sp. UWO 241]|nr:hypothetical protein FOA52_003844 [Chlamydomonas sp. UWO 241]